MTRPDALTDLDLLGEHDAWLRALARRLVQDEETARDVAQETWLQAFQQPPDPERPIRTWLTTVARRTATRITLRDRRRSTRERGQPSAAPLPTPDQLLERAESSHRLTAALTALPEPYRACLLLRYQEGLPTKEIARRSGEPEGTVRWRLAAGRMLLRERLEPDKDARRRLLSVLLVPAGSKSAAACIVTGVTWMSLKTAASAVAGLAVLVVSVFLLATANPERARTADDAARSPAVEVSSVPLADQGLLANGAAIARSEVDVGVGGPNLNANSDTGDASRGRVLAQDGAPIQGAWVMALEDSDEDRNEETGDDGDEDYRWPMASIRTTTAKDGSFQTPRHGPKSERLWIAGADGFATRAGAERDGDGAMVFHLRPAGEVFGTVREFGTLRPISGVRLIFGDDLLFRDDPRGPTTDARISVYQWREDGPVHVVTGPDGTFRFRGAPLGEPISVEAWPEGSGLQRRVLRLEDAAPIRFDILLARGRDIALRLIDAESGAPVVGARLWGSPLVQPTDADGRVTLLRGFCEETLTVEAQPDGYCLTVLTRDRETLPLDRELLLPVLRRASVRGRLLDAGGQPLERALIRIRQAPDVAPELDHDPLRDAFATLDRDDVRVRAQPDSWSVRTDDQGQFQTEGLVPRSYPVRLMVSEGGDPWPIATFTLEVDRSDDPHVVELRMPALATVTGSVTLNGEPAREAKVIFFVPGDGVSVRAVTDAAGAFSLRVAAGDGTLSVTPSGISCPATHEQALTLSPGAVHPIHIDLDYAAQEIAGRVVDLDGDPVTNAYVGQGRYRVRLDDGRFRLRFHAPRQDSWSLCVHEFPFEFDAGEYASGTQNALLVVATKGASPLRVIDGATGLPIPRFLVAWTSADPRLRVVAGDPVALGESGVDGVAWVELPQGDLTITIDASLFGFPKSAPQTIRVRSHERAEAIREVRLERSP